MRLTGAAALALVALATSAHAGILSSAHYRILGAHTNGGSSALLVPATASPNIGALGASVGQAEALGVSGSPDTLRTIAPGFWPLVGGFPTLDADADVIPAYRDNCPFAYNPSQSDSGGIASVVPDGVGDACQCGDVNGDGGVNSLDTGTYRAALAALLVLAPANLAKCSVIAGLPECTIRDVSVMARALGPVPYLPGIDQTCAAATPP